MQNLFRLTRGWKKNVHLRKIWMTMKLTAFLFFLGIMQMMASEAYSQTAKLTLQLKDVAVKQVLDQIEENSEFFFLYNSKLVDVNRKVDVDEKNQKINEILNNLFRQTEVVYTVVDRQIVLTNKADQVGFMKLSSQQPEKSVTGKVTDRTGASVPGATIVVKGTTNGVVSDNNGNFSLANIPENATLVFSFIGMKTQEISVTNKTIINVVMEDETIALEEVVAIGYGVIKRQDLTGSVSSISGAALKDIPVTSAAQAIVGRMAGVQVTKTEGSPDADIKIRIRGGGSLTQDNSPLYIVDGFPVSSINDISPTDIATIDILKDASSTAIYGARGANGVILITTKRGADGKGKVSYNAYWGVKNITKMLDVLSPYDYAYWQYEVQTSTGTSIDNIEKYLGDFRDYKLYNQLTATNWQDEVFGRTGTSMSNNLTFSGGSKTSNYNVSLTRNDEKEIMIGSDYARTNLTIKTSNAVNDWLTIDLNTRLSDYSLNGAGTSANGSLNNALQFRPVEGLGAFVDGELVNSLDFESRSNLIYNPVSTINADYHKVMNLLFNFNGAATIKFSKTLNYRFEYGTQFGDNTDNRFFGVDTYTASIYGGQPLAAISKLKSKSYRVANVFTYSKRDFLPGQNLTVMAGQELNYSKSLALISSARYFPKNVSAVSAISMMSLGLPDPIVSSDNPDNKVSSFFGRLNYDYKGKYLASATFRADGSSKFAPGNQWGYFPSAALAWRATSEQFMNSTKKWLTDLKLRASYGESGNNRISDNAWQKTFSISTTDLYASGNETTATPYLVPGAILSNPKLKWETTVTRNIGLDFGLFKNRLTGSAEVYKNTTRDLLIQATIPANTGYTRQWQNIGQTSNKGLEMVLNGVIIEKKDFKLSGSFNIGFNRNHIDKLGDTKTWFQASGWMSSDGPSGDYLIKEGGELGVIYGYVTDGMYSFDDFTYANGVYTIKPNVPNSKAVTGAMRFEPGSLKLKDQNGDFVINDADKVVIGNASPKHTGGFNLTAQYKGFDFSSFFNWVYGNNIYNAVKLGATTYYGARNYKNLLNIMNSDDRFVYNDKATGALVTDPTKLADLNKNATIWAASMGVAQLHSWGIEDGSFLRLNNLTIGYSLPKSLLASWHIDQLRLYVSGYNLWIWTKYTGFDPEVDTRRDTPLTPGVDWNAYPRSRTFNVGINLTF